MFSLKIVAAVVIGFVFAPCRDTALAGDQAPTSGKGSFLSQKDAERILGQQALLQDSSGNYRKGLSVYQNSYKATVTDQKTGKTGAVYYLLEQYDLVSAAQKKYSGTWNANKDHGGIKQLDDVGDEAYFHSDGENFCFIMVRKNSLVFTMKVNKLTSKTSLEAFNEVARRLVSQL